MDTKIPFLVVDDIEAVRRIIIKNLKIMGVENVVTASNGAEAMLALQSRKIGAVITDLNMPVMSGLDLVKAIRADARIRNLPILMVTAEAERHKVQQAVVAGVSDFMVKPFTVNNLEAKLNKIIANPRPAIAAAKAAPAVAPAAVPLTPQTVPELQAQDTELSSIAFDDSFWQRLAGDATLLVVDDVPENLDVLVELLGEKYHVRGANSGERALKILDSGKIPDLILLDVMMPEMDGFEVCRRIKANPATADIPVIFLTAMNETTDVMQGFELGAVDYVTKPVDPPILEARIRTHLKLKRSLDEIRLNHAELLKQHTILADNFRLRDEVERIVHHDLKNPIGGIINFSSILLEGGMSAEDRKEIVQDIEQSAYSALNMVNLSLDLYKMEQKTYEFTPGRVDIAQILQRIVKEKKSELKSRNVAVQLMMNGDEVDKHEPFHVFGDELLCYSMFGNLFKNAMEAASAETAIRIELHDDENDEGDENGDRAIISIANNGAVLKEIRERFFDKFVTAGKPGGTGLGTYSAKLIAETQRGKIAMNASDENDTTTVTVMLPRPAREREPQAGQ